VLLSALVATGSLTVLVPQSSANQVGDLKAQAKTIAQKLVQEQLQIDAYQQQYSVDSAKVTADAQAIATVDQQVAQDQQQFGTDTAQVRELAITSYMNGGELTGSDAALFEGNAEEVQSANEYDSIATGSIETALNQLQTAQDALAAQQAALHQQQAKDQSDASNQATALSQADATEQAMETEQSLVTGRLAAAVAAQAGAEDAAAAKAVAAAQKSGSKSGAGGTKSGPAGPGTGIGTGAGAGPAIPDPTLPPFLQCVVQAESGGNYSVVSPNGMYMGAFQFSQSTWNFAARAAGLVYLVGVPPNHATKAEQDTVAVALFALDGEQPWLGDRCSA
jgi:peptidoglycan hydrolase CwlO-like protein